ncbi:MAG: tyrosine-type recombinase/integrase [Candidatus Aquicultor sp.]
MEMLAENRERTGEIEKVSGMTAAALIREAGLKAVSASATYSHYAADYFRYTEETGLRTTDPETLRAWASAKLADHAPASLVPMLAAVKKALRGAAKELTSAKEAAAFSEALRDIKPPKKATGAVRRSFILTPKEERATLARMTPRDMALFMFLMATGARISEALNIKLDDCKQDGSMVRVPLYGKGGKMREVRIDAALFSDIVAVYGPTSSWLFQTSGGKPVLRDYAFRRVSSAVMKATGKHFSPHGARHTFATRAIERTGKLKAVSEYLGHASASITLDMYVHETLEDDEIVGLSR